MKNEKNTLHIDNVIELPEVQYEDGRKVKYIEAGYWFEGDEEMTVEKIPLSTFQRFVEENDLLTVFFEEHNTPQLYSRDLKAVLTFKELLSSDWREYLISRVREYLKIKLGDNVKLFSSIKQYKEEVARLEMELKELKGSGMTITRASQINRFFSSDKSASFKASKQA